MNNKHNETVRPMTRSQLAEIIVTMMVNIPELSSAKAQAIIGDKNRLADGVEELFAKLVCKQRDSYGVTVDYSKSLGQGVTVDYSKSLGQMVNAGEYDWVNDNITADHFPVKSKGNREADIVLFHFDENMESGDVIAEMNKEGYRPATVEELAALGEKCPDLQRQFPIVALGSVWWDSDGDRLVPYLDRDGSERFFDLGWFDDGWIAYYRFAAVRKQ